MEAPTTKKLSNKDKMMTAAIDLMAERGYKGVSTKEIAASAGFSEMTLFRYFGSKRKLLEEAIDRFYYTGEMQRIFAEEMVWDLCKDLLLVSKTYHEIMHQNRKLIRIVLQDNELADLRKHAEKHPRQLKERLTDYFESMQSKGRMIPTRPEAQAMTFMWMNYGAFMTGLYGASSMTAVSLEEFMQSSIELFARGLTP